MKLFFIIICICIVAYTLRRIPWIGIPSEPSHLFVSTWSSIEIVAKTGHIPHSTQYPGINNFRITKLDHWFRLVFFPVIFEVVGMSTQKERLDLIRTLLIPLFGVPLSGLLIVGKKVSIRMRAFTFIFLLFIGQMYVDRTSQGLHDWGYGAMFFCFTVACLVQGIRKKNKTWFSLSIPFSIYVLATRHTMGLILLFCWVILAFCVVLFKIGRKNQIQYTFLTTITLFIAIDVLYYSYLANVFSWGIIEVGRILIGQGFGGSAETISISGTTLPKIGFSKVLSVVDRLLLVVIIGITGLAWLPNLASFPEKLKISPLNLVNIPNESDKGSVSIVIFLMLGYPVALGIFYIFKGLPGLIGRGQQYLTLYALVAGPILIFIFFSEANKSPKYMRVLVVLIFVITALISQGAFLTSSNTIEGKSAWLSQSEKHSLDNVREFVPTDARIAGSYHSVPPLVDTHPCLVGPDFSFTNKEYETIVRGLYYNVSAQNTSEAFSELNSRFGQINHLIISERVTGRIGVNSEARHPGPAPESIWRSYQSVPFLNHVYSGPTHVYSNSERKNKCEVKYQYG